MARVLELVDMTEDPSVVMGDTATLEDTGKVTYQGDGVREIIAKFLVDNSGEDVFNKMADWSNGYVQLREREGEE